MGFNGSELVFSACSEMGMNSLLSGGEGVGESLDKEGFSGIKEASQVCERNLL